MPTFDPSDLIGSTLLLPPEENGERHRAKVTRQLVEIIDQDNGQRVKISSGSPHGYPEGSSPEQKAPTVFLRSRDEEYPSVSKPMPTFDPSDLIGRTFLLPPEENGERHRAKVTRHIVEIIDQDNGQRIDNINFVLDLELVKLKN